VHPGFVATELGRTTAGISIANWFARSPPAGAMTQIYLAVSPDVEKITGKYWANTKITTSNAATYVVANTLLNVGRNVVADQKRLWEVSAKMVGLENAEL
jgi:hypothetical protein